MGFKYNDYCYSTLNEIGDLIVTQSTFETTTGVGAINDYSVDALTNTLKLNIKHQQIQPRVTLYVYTGSINISLPTCTEIGFLETSNDFEHHLKQNLAFDSSLIAYVTGSTIAAFILGFILNQISKIIRFKLSANSHL